MNFMLSLSFVLLNHDITFSLGVTPVQEPEDETEPEPREPDPSGSTAVTQLAGDSRELRWARETRAPLFGFQPE